MRKLLLIAGLAIFVASGSVMAHDGKKKSCCKSKAEKSATLAPGATPATATSSSCSKSEAKGCCSKSKSSASATKAPAPATTPAPAVKTAN